MYELWAFSKSSDLSFYSLYSVIRTPKFQYCEEILTFACLCTFDLGEVLQTVGCCDFVESALM